MRADRQGRAVPRYSVKALPPDRAACLSFVAPRPTRITEEPASDGPSQTLYGTAGSLGNRSRPTPTTPRGQRMLRSEIAQANAIVTAVTHLLELVDEEDEDEVLLRIYADEETFRLAHPQAEHLDNALHTRIVRTGARAASRIGYDITVVRLRAEPMRAWLAQQIPSGAHLEDYPGEPDDRLSSEAALRALGLSAADLKEAPRKPAQGKTLAARIARWATDPEADESLINDLIEELLSQRLDGALGIVEKMLEPEDYAYTRHEIDLTASGCVLGDKGREREAVLFVSPVLRDGDDPRAPDVPAGLQGRLTGIALGPSFVELILAPYWIPTAALARLKPSELREAAEALANGLEPPIQRASPADRDVCLLGLTIPMVALRIDDDEEEDEDTARDRLDAWLAVVAPGWARLRCAPARPDGCAETWADSLMTHGSPFGVRPVADSSARVRALVSTGSAEPGQSAPSCSLATTLSSIGYSLRGGAIVPHDDYSSQARKRNKLARSSSLERASAHALCCWTGCASGSSSALGLDWPKQ